MAKPSDLNKLIIADADGSGFALEDFRAESIDGKTTVLFKNLENELITRIRSADVVIGCVAWLTSEPILRELARKAGVSLVVQKEDFLRPDLAPTNNWRRRLRKLYLDLPATLSRYDGGFAETRLHLMSFATDPTIDAVRCVGNHNAAKASAFPRAHHKFVVFCKRHSETSSSSNYPRENAKYTNSFEPYEVWTGSFNFTKNATFSFENAVVSCDPNIVAAFTKEFGQIAALSEPLDWESIWVAPEWRVGT